MRTSLSLGPISDPSEMVTCRGSWTRSMEPSFCLYHSPEIAGKIEVKHACHGPSSGTRCARETSRPCDMHGCAFKSKRPADPMYAIEQAKPDVCEFFVQELAGWSGRSWNSTS